MSKEIMCQRCQSDTGYTENTPVEDRHHSFKPGIEDSRGELHFCSVCWIADGYKVAFDRD